MLTSIRNFRIAEETWRPAREKADQLGISLTFVVKAMLRDFAQRGEFTISAPIEMKMPKSTMLRGERLAAAARVALRRDKPKK